MQKVTQLYYFKCNFSACSTVTYKHSQWLSSVPAMMVIPLLLFFFLLHSTTLLHIPLFLSFPVRLRALLVSATSCILASHLLTLPALFPLHGLLVLVLLQAAADLLDLVVGVADLVVVVVTIAVIVAVVVVVVAVDFGRGGGFFGVEVLRRGGV